MNKNFKTLLLAMAALGVVGCSDDLSDGAGTAQGEAESGYIAFKISTVGTETRATADEGDPEDEENDTTPGESETENDDNVPEDENFDTGKEFEYKVTEERGANVVFFYDENDKFHSFSILESIAEAENPNHDDADHSYGNNADEIVYEARVLGNKEKIAKCLVVLNGKPDVLQGLRGKSLSEMLAECDADMGWYGEYFTMTNAVYVAVENSKLISANTVQTATAIDPEEHIRPTQALAKEHPITVHVERILAKFELTSQNDAVEEATTITPTDEAGESVDKIFVNVYDSKTDKYAAEEYEWTVKINGWGVNATETKTYWVKNIPDLSSGTSEYSNNGAWTFGNWHRSYNSDFGYGWNDATRLRSYWAVDPHYNNSADKYPQQYRKAEDSKTVNEEGNESYDIVSGDDDDDAVLEYKSYKEFVRNVKNCYAVENTFDPKMFNDKTSSDNYQFHDNNYLRAATHIILAAELQVTGLSASTTLYQYDSYYWEAADNSNKTDLQKDWEEDRYSDMPDTLKTEILSQILFQYMSAKAPIYVKNTEGELVQLTAAEMRNYFVWTEATIKNGDGRVMAKFAENTDKIEWYKLETTADEDYKKWEKSDFDEFQKYIYTYGSARRFDHGKMYYAIPIKHMVTTKLDEDNNVMQYNVGSYGVVRNHWYKVNVKTISKPGIPVDDPDQPIIPNDDPDAAAYASFEVVILPWHVIEQNENL